MSTIIGGIMFLVFLAVAIAAFVFWIWMLIDCVKNDGLTGTERVIWALVIFITHFLGAVIYFFVGRPKHSTR
jgi:hypothetical protein